ncbi:hypothetical protein HYW19_04100 [Candidatus Woesearchaeota archaeon]|nr:hypothetical protein [Candidatus Woesearchaeota archaeon]
MEQQILNGIASSNFGNSYLIEKKFEVMLDNASKKLMAEVLKIKESLTLLQEDVKELKRSGVQAPAQVNAQVNYAYAESRRSASSESARTTHDNINPKDVAVEKMFYFGNKR